MNKLLLLLFLPLSIFAQPFVKCYTTEYYHQFKQEHPEIVQNEAVDYAKVNEWLNKNRSSGSSIQGTQSVITIPVVVHIVHYSTSDSLSDQVVQSQIDALNKDYSRTNSDSVQTPLPFRIVAGNPQIQFCLAQRTPTGQWTNGIERRKTSISVFTSTDNVKFYVTGGLDAWNTSQYLNLWVCNISEPVLGVATDPYITAGTVYDGVVIDYTAFGTTGSVLQSKYNKGRTATHEIGHWLGLYHIWGNDNGGCGGSDSIADTPDQSNSTYNCPAYPKTDDSCSPGFPGIMFMNYMDYTDDVCMNLFTSDQAVKMNAVLNVLRTSLISSSGCIPVGIEDANLNTAIRLFPNPAREQFTVSGLMLNVEATIELYNMLGERVYSDKLENRNSRTEVTINVSFAPGIYQLVLRTDNGVASKKISVVR